MTTSATLTMLVTDAVASTTFRHAQGDTPAHERMARIETIVGEAARGRGGRLVKNTGDGQLLVFESARSAVSAALDMQRTVHRLNDDEPAAAISIRAGIHTGEAITEASDVHGTAVVAAFRINGKAASEEVLVSEMVRGVLGGANEFAFIERGRFSLKGFRERWRLYQVPWRPAVVQPEERDCAILITDIHHSTQIAFGIGEQRAFRYLRASHAILRAAAAANSAVFVQVAGDSGLLAFRTADQAVSAARAIREATNAYTQENPSMPMRTRMGLDQGPILREADEIYGLAIFVTARLVAVAEPGEVLMTEGVLASLPPGVFAVGQPRSATLTALPGERLVYPLE